MGIGNGKLISSKIIDDKKEWVWQVENPINLYNIAPVIGNFVGFSDTYNGLNGKLSLQYFVLKQNLEKAKMQFTQVPGMLDAMEHWFGPYPFYKDSYKLVETPFLGMEHQSNIAYGNGFKNGYLGQDLSETGIGNLFDFIIIHESGHEWFGNNITAKNPEHMWIHEAFTTYSETLYVEQCFGKEYADDYVIGQRARVVNDGPMLGKSGSNEEGSGDMYFKGANMIHSIRTVLDDDKLFRKILQGMNAEFWHSTVTTQQILDYWDKQSNKPVSSIFSLYLNSNDVPTLEYYSKDEILNYRIPGASDSLYYPMKISNGIVIEPTGSWKQIKFSGKYPLFFNSKYYVIPKEVTN